MLKAKQITATHLNTAIELAEARGCRAKDITSLVVHDDGEGVTIGLGLDSDGLARFVSNRGFGL
jgi:hypothetical protein